MPEIDHRGRPDEQAPVPGETHLVVGRGDPVGSDATLRALEHIADPEDVAVVVTTTRSGTTTVERFHRLVPADSRPTLELVDTTSEHQYVARPYAEVPTVYTPSPADLERVVLGLSELTGGAPPATRHLVVRSLTPMLEAAGVDPVERVLERVSGLVTGGGVGLFGVDVTAHDRETVERLVGAVDGVLVYDVGADGSVRLRRESPGAYLASR